MSIFNIFSKKEPLKLPFTTDIHCHIIPGVDDGSPDLETSVKLVRHMQSWGISRIIASPHVTEETFENTAETLDPPLESLNKELARLGINIPVTRSSENRIDDYFRMLLDKGLVKTLPNDYILVECSFIQEPWELDQFLYELRVKGLRPILAHPERYFYFHERDYGRYKQLHDMGTYFQVNVLSLAGGYSKTEKKVAEGMIERGMVDFLGTDLHNFRHVGVIEEYLQSKDAGRHFRAIGGRLMNDFAFIKPQS